MNYLLRFTVATVLLSCCFFTAPASAASTVADDHVALKDLKQAKAIFDVRLADMDRLLFNLGLISETWNGIKRQGVNPTMVVTVRGAVVRLFAKDQATSELTDLLAELEKKGIRVELCSVATRIYHVNNSQLIPQVTLVGNVLTSQIAWQNKGYALVTMN